MKIKIPQLMFEDSTIIIMEMAHLQEYVHMVHESGIASYYPVSHEAWYNRNVNIEETIKKILGVMI